MSPARKARHHRFLLRRRHLPVQQPEPKTGEILGFEALDLLGGRTRLQLGRALDEWAHHVGLATGFHLGTHVRVHRHPLERAGADRLGGDR